MRQPRHRAERVLWARKAASPLARKVSVETAARAIGGSQSHQGAFRTRSRRGRTYGRRGGSLAVRRAREALMSGRVHELAVSDDERGLKLRRRHRCVRPVCVEPRAVVPMTKVIIGACWAVQLGLQRERDRSERSRASSGRPRDRAVRSARRCPLVSAPRGWLASSGPESQTRTPTQSVGRRTVSDFLSVGPASRRLLR